MSLASRAPGVSPALLSVTSPRRFLLLTFHRVNDDGHPFFGGTPVALFRRQLEALRRSFDVRPLGELLARVRDSGEVPPNAAAVTFDDGYRDNYTHAFPVLRELGVPATIFLVTRALDENALIWHDRVFDAFHRTERDRLELDGTVGSLGSTAERETVMNGFLAKIRRVSPEERDARIDALVEALDVGPIAGGAWDKLRWDEVREMARGGIDFGSHTVDHPILSQVSEEEARRQVRESRARIEEELDEPVTAFAYPNGRPGDFDASTKRILEEEGFECALTTEPGANDAGTDRFELRRVGMWGDDPQLSVLRLARSRLVWN